MQRVTNHRSREFAEKIRVLSRLSQIPERTVRHYLTNDLAPLDVHRRRAWDRACKRLVAGKGAR